MSGGVILPVFRPASHPLFTPHRLLAFFPTWAPDYPLPFLFYLFYPSFVLCLRTPAGLKVFSNADSSP